MKIVAIIPARYNSQRLPAKVLTDICGKSMIERVYLQVKKSKLVNDIFIATDDMRIANEVKKFGGKYILTSSKIETGSDRIAIASKKIKCDIIVNVQGDEPLINPKVIDLVVKILIKDKNAIVGTVVKIINNASDLTNPNIVKVVTDKNNFALYFSRSPIPFVRDAKNYSDWLKKQKYFKHFGIYVYRKSALLSFTKFSQTELEKSEKLEQLRFLSNGIKIKVAETKSDSIAVDTFSDLEKVRKIISSQKNLK